MKWVDYREKLGLGINDVEKTSMLRNKLKNSLNYLSSNKEYLGGYEQWKDTCEKYYYDVGEQAGFFNDSLVESITNHLDSKMIICHYVAFMNAFCKHFQDEKNQKWIRNMLYKALNDLNIPYDIHKDNDGFFIFPKGAKELDDALVSETLEWMNEYPKSHKAWVKALKEYSNQTDENASDVADKFRKSLETFFQEFFGGAKTLENYKSLYGTYLKDAGVPSELCGNFETLLQSYTNYINNFAKHQDKTNRNILEYLMYQTGNIIRLLITLKQEDKTNAD